jgi:hypothetical protein
MREYDEEYDELFEVDLDEVEDDIDDNIDDNLGIAEQQLLGEDLILKMTEKECHELWLSRKIKDRYLVGEKDEFEPFVEKVENEESAVVKFFNSMLIRFRNITSN